MKGILLPEMTSKKIDIRCLEYRDIQKVGGNKVKQELVVRVGVEQDLAKTIVKLLRIASSRSRLASRAMRCG